MQRGSVLQSRRPASRLAVAAGGNLALIEEGARRLVQGLRVLAAA